MSNESNKELNQREGEVHLNALEELIIRVVDSENNLEQDFYLIFNQIEKRNRKEFLELFVDWIQTKRFKLFFENKYIDSRKENNPPFKYSYLEMGRAEIDDPLYVNGLKKKEDLKFLATDFWIERKIWELEQLIPELNSLFDKLFGSSSKIELNSNSYNFPENLIDNEFDIMITESFRVPVNSSLENLKLSLHESLEELKYCMGEVNYEAFLYNSFQFKGNSTTPTPLNIPYPNKVKIGVFLSTLFKLYENFDEVYSSKKTEFMKIMVLNFNKHRAKFSNKNFDLNDHLEAISKRVKNHQTII